MRKKKVMLTLSMCFLLTMTGCGEQNEIIRPEISAFEPAVAVREDNYVADASETTIVGETVISGEVVTSYNDTTPDNTDVVVVSEVTETSKIIETSKTVDTPKATEETKKNAVTEKDKAEVPTQESIAGDISAENNTKEVEDNSITDTISFGTYRGYQYTNRYLGFMFIPSTGWTAMSKNQIYEKNNLMPDQPQEVYDEYFKTAKVITDLVAAFGTTDSVTLSYNRLSGAGLMADESLYLNTAMKTIASHFTNLGFENVIVSKSTTKFLGKEKECIRVEGTKEGVSAYQVIIYVKKGNYVANITAGSFGEDHSDLLLEHFTSIR